MPSFRKFHGWFAGVACLALLMAACSGQSLKDPDGDETRLKARPFKHLEPTEDKLDVAAGDLEDWRFFQPEKAGKLEIRVSIGKWEESTLVGFITIFTEVGDRVLERPIAPGSGITIKAEFDVEASMRYLVRFKATSGKGRYAVEVGEPENACSACTDKQECVENKCVDKPCGGCGDGETCDKGSGKCLKVKAKPEDKCADVKCPSGHFCVRQTGRCAKERTGDKEEKKCGPGEIEKGGECVAKPQDLECAVIDVRESGGGSILTLNCGDNKQVTKGTSGSIRGVKGGTFSVTDVYPSRSKAACKLPPAKFPSNPVAVIKR
jgi:hypothetical protein